MIKRMALGSRGIKKIPVLVVFSVLMAATAFGQVLYSEGARTSRWGGIGIVQTNLNITASGVFGDETRGAIESLQALTSHPVTGEIDSATWALLTGRQAPTIQERSEALTLLFEGTDFDDWEWNYPYERRDPSGATWGPFGLTVLHNEVQEIFGAIEKRDPSLLPHVFGNLYPYVRELSGRKGVAAKTYLKKRIYSSKSRRVRWVSCMRALATDAVARTAYLETGRQFFLPKVRALDDAYPIETELDYAFYWDLAIHTSGLTPARKARIDREIESRVPETAADRRAVISKVFEQTLGNRTQRNTRHQRDRVYVHGSAVVHGDKVSAAAFGLADRPYASGVN